jgi:hypothetical protein
MFQNGHVDSDKGIILLRVRLHTVDGESASLTRCVLEFLQCYSSRLRYASSAVARRICGTVKPSALAVFRLMTSSNWICYSPRNVTSLILTLPRWPSSRAEFAKTICPLVIAGKLRVIVRAGPTGRGWDRTTQFDPFSSNTPT